MLITHRLVSQCLPVLVLCLFLFISGGCRTYSRARPKSHSDVGSTHLSVLSVTRFDDYKNALQPTFNLTPDQALKQAIPDTLQFEQALFDAFRAKVGLKLAPSDVLPAGFGDGQAGSGVPSGDLGSAPEPSGQPASVLKPADLRSDPHLSYLAATALFQEVKLINRYVKDAAIRENYKAYIVRLQLTNMPNRRHLEFDTYVNLGFFLQNVGIPTDASVAKMTDDTSNEIKSIFNQLKLLSTPVPNLKKLDIKNGTIPDSVEEHITICRSLVAVQSEIENRIANEERVIERLKSHLAVIAEKTNRLQKMLDDGAGKLDEKKKQGYKAQIQNYKDENAVIKKQLEEREGFLKMYKALILQINSAIKKIKEAIAPHLGNQVPLIVPLLVTDQVEAALASRRAEHMRQLALSLAAAYAGIGGTVDADSLSSAMRSAAGRDFNSLFTVGRVTDNTLRVRIGARQTGRPRDGAKPKEITRANLSYEMVPQTHNISLLVLVPGKLVASQSKPVYVSSQTEYVNARTGRSVRYRHRGAQNQSVKKSLYKLQESEWQWTNKDGSPLTFNENTLYQLASYAQNFNRPDFVVALEKCKPKLPVATKNRIWMDLSTARVGSEYDKTVFTAMKYPTVQPRIKSNQIILVDNGKTTTGTVFDTAGLDADRVSARWVFHDAKKARYELSSTAAKVESGGKHLSLTFPSVAALKIAPITGASPEDIVGVQMNETPGGLRLPEHELGWLYHKASVAKEKIAVTVTPNALTASKKDDDVRFVLFQVAKPKAAKGEKINLLLSVTGSPNVELFKGAVKDANRVGEGDKINSFEVDANVTYRLKLSQLNEKAKVKLSFKDNTKTFADVTHEIEVTPAVK